MNVFSSLITNVSESGNTPQVVTPSSSRDSKRKRRCKNAIGYKRKGIKKWRKKLSLPSLDVPPPPETSSILRPPQSPPLGSAIARGPKNMRMTVKQAESMRITIDTIFRQKYADTYTSEKLNGTDGVVLSICRDINYFQAPTVRHVVLQSYIAIQDEKEYNAKRKTFKSEPKRKIQNGIYEHHLLTVLKEGNNSFRQCTEALNSLHYAMEEKPAVGITAVYNAINLCNFEKIKTRKVMQTNTTNLTYRQARFNWLAQLLARMGGDIPDNDGSDVRNNLKDEWIDHTILKEKGFTFDLDQVAFWDECHIKQVAGTCFDETLVFARDEDGVYDRDVEVDVEANEKVSNSICR